MLCDQCCSHMHRTISMLQGNTVNCMAYGCSGGKCDRELRVCLDQFYHDWVQKKRDERNNKAPSSSPV